MSVFSPNTWVAMGSSRTRTQTATSTADFSGSLEGLHYVPNPTRDDPSYINHRFECHKSHCHGEFNDECESIDDVLPSPPLRRYRNRMHEVEFGESGRDNEAPAEPDTFQRNIHPRDLDHNPRTPVTRIPSIHRLPSFGDSCISSLSADETHYDFDETKTLKSLDTLSITEARPKTQPLETISRGRDFGSAFDHLVDHLHGAGGTQHVSFGHDSSVEHNLKQQSQQTRHQLLPKQNHRRKASLHVGERPRPIHHRAHSDTQAFRPVPTHRPNRSTVMHSRKPSQLPAHATLMECVTAAKEVDSSNRLLPNNCKPQILQARSTSNTVLSSVASSSIVSQGSGSGSASGVVWSGQPIDAFSTPKSISNHSSQHFFHNSTGRHRSNASCMNFSRDAICPQSNTLAASPSEFQFSSQSIGSGWSHASHTENYSMDNVERSLTKKHNSRLSAKKTKPKSSGKIHRGHTRTSSEDSNSMGQESKSEKSVKTPRRKKVSIKKELKFIVDKMIPSPMKGRRNKPSYLKRSGDGCLT